MTISGNTLTSRITPIEDLYTTPQKIVVKVEAPIEKAILLSNAVEEIQVESAGTGLTVLKLVGVALTLFGVIAALVGNHAHLNGYHLTVGTVVVAPIHLIVTGLALALLGLTLIYFSYPKPVLDPNPDPKGETSTQPTKVIAKSSQELSLAEKNKLLEAEVARLKKEQSDIYGIDFFGPNTPSASKNSRPNDDINQALLGVTPYRKQHIVEQKQLHDVHLRSKDLVTKVPDDQHKIVVPSAQEAPSLQPKPKTAGRKENKKVESSAQGVEKPLTRPRASSVITFDQELQAKLEERKNK